MRILLIVIFLIFPAIAIAQENLSVSAEVFGKLPEIKQIQLSPEGDKYLMLRNVDGKISIVTKSIQNEKLQPNLIPFDEGKFLWAKWVSNEKIITAVSKIENPNSLWERNYIIVMDWDGKNRTVWSYFEIIDLLEDDEDHILVNSTRGIVKLNIITSELEHQPGGRSYGFNYVRADKNGVARFGGVRSRGFSVIDVEFEGVYRKNEKSKWRKIYKFTRSMGIGRKAKNEIERPFSFAEFTDDPNIIYVSKKDENGFETLFKYNVDSKEFLEKVVEIEGYDIGDYNFNDDYELEYYSYHAEKPIVIRLGEKGKKLTKIFEKNFPNSLVRIVSKTKNEQVMILKVSSPQEPGSYYLLDLNKKRLELISYNYRGLDTSKLSRMRHVSYIARDGLKINGYLSLPENKSNNKNLPTVILPHGGPIARDTWGFDYRVQFLTSLGYAVLQMNYLGSTGYGEDFILKGFHEWGRNMLNDINDGTKWMIEQGYSDPDNICIMGGSYGGYAALQSVVRENALYKCSIAFAPVTNLKSQFFRRRTNFVESKDWTYDEASPQKNIDKINIPVLLIHGNQDTTVNIKTSRSFNKDMVKKDKDIKYIEFDEGDHSLSNQEHRIEFLSEVEKFLEKHIGSMN